MRQDPRKTEIIAFALLVLGALSCVQVPPPPLCGDAGCAAELLPKTDNPIELAARSAFLEMGHLPRREGDLALCRRLFADLVGRFPSKA